jgi:hypothetical protein
MRSIIKRGAPLLAVTLGALAVGAGPAHAKGALANPYDCAPAGALNQSFLPFGDSALYTPVANAGFEQGAESWTLTGGAAVVAGNEPWSIGGPGQTRSLDLPSGSVAVSAPFCVDPTYPYFRVFARGTGALKVEVLAYDTKGKLLKTSAYSLAATTAWQPSPNIAISVFDYKKALVSAAPVSFRFTPGKNAHFAIDDLYVDPRARY